MARASNCTTKDDHEGAEQEYHRIIDDFDGIVPAQIYYELATSLMEQRDRDEEAIALFDTALELSQLLPTAVLYKTESHNRKAALLHRARSDYEGAIAKFESTLRLSPSDPSANRWLPQFKKAKVTGVLERPE